MNSPLLKIDNITYTYKTSQWQLNSVSLEVAKGDFLAIVGTNGAGKSTLLKISAGIIPPNTGNVTIHQKPISKIPRKALARQIGYLPQYVNPIFDYNVRQVVAMGRFCHSKSFALTTAEDNRIVNHCLEITETTPFKNRNITELSGGERQRVMLASVLAQQPDIMLLDEPATGLDLHHQTAFFKLLAELSKKRIAIMVITHDLNLAAQFCSKMLLMHKGKKQICDTPDKVFEKISNLPEYSKDICFFPHPLNSKPAVLPANNQTAPEKTK
jgi:iron complex transport system ATP-binding protein